MYSIHEMKVLINLTTQLPNNESFPSILFELSDRYG